MVVKLFNVPSCFATLFLLYLFGGISVIHGGQFCEYSKGNDRQPLNKWCPHTCCSTKPRYENSTCCQTVILHSASALTIMGYSWWVIFLCVLCLFTATSIVIHYTKRIHLLKHSKYFNAYVEPGQAFTISKSELNIRTIDPNLTVESQPPSYQTSVSPPPAYTSIHP